MAWRIALAPDGKIVERDGDAGLLNGSNLERSAPVGPRWHTSWPAWFVRFE